MLQLLSEQDRFLFAAADQQDVEVPDGSIAPITQTVRVQSPPAEPAPNLRQDFSLLSIRPGDGDNKR